MFEIIKKHEGYVLQEIITKSNRDIPFIKNFFLAKFLPDKEHAYLRLGKNYIRVPDELAYKRLLIKVVDYDNKFEFDFEVDKE